MRGVTIIQQLTTAERSRSAPEAILTERNLKRIPEAQQKSLADLHPIQRLGSPEDVACAALYLASDESAWITGVILDVAGGAVRV